jgi:hypothetical protein
MKRTIKNLLALTIITLFSSFTHNANENFIGSYGVSATDPSMIKLVIKDNHTFSYQDFSVPKSKIEVQGNWILKGKKVLLLNNGTQTKFHDVWTFEANGNVAKSHKGISFYRLCKLND